MVKKVILNIFIILLIVVFIFSCYKIFKSFSDNKKTVDMIEQIQNEVITIVDKENEEVKDEDNYIEEDVVEEDKLILDFPKLLEINDDTVAWIKISNTNIDYPIVQTTNNDYYLNHSFDKSKNQNGWPFLNSSNNSDFSDQNTILFGHNTNGYTMFSELKDIYNNKLGNDITVYIYLENDVITYKVFSIYLEDPTNVSSISRYMEEDVLEEIKRMSKVNFDVDVDINDKILTLSTCYNESDERIIMHAGRV